MITRLIPFLAVATTLCMASAAVADVYRCTTDDKVIYADSPCGDQAKKLVIDPPPDPFAAKRVRSKLGSPGTKLQIPESLAMECFDMYRVFARDPTTAKAVSYSARIAPIGAPIVTVTSVFTNKNGGPDRYEAWCGLTDELAIDKTATEKSIEHFRETQDDFYAKMRGIQRALK